MFRITVHRTIDLQATKHACTAGYKNVAIRILACGTTSINFPSQHVALFMQKLKEKNFRSTEQVTGLHC